MSNERPILFSTPMVRAIMAGRKMVTRRVVKPQPNYNGISFMKNPPFYWESYYRQEWKPWKMKTDEGESIALHCPYGQPGDLLWVRETWLKMVPEHIGRYAYRASIDAEEDEIRKEYIKAGYPYKWKPSIHMPKSAARIWLRVKAVRVERLQDISTLSAQREGIEKIPRTSPLGAQYKDYLDTDSSYYYPVYSFQSLWESINGLESWAANPWVWVVEFERVER